MNKQISCFFAYAANPADIAESLELAIEQINREGVNLINVTGWKSIGVVGRLVIDEVCQFIDKSDIFICDLTTFSMNVLFELGYAIAKNKKIWITLKPSYKNSTQDYKKLGLLATVGYTTYENSYELKQKFFNEISYDDLSSTLYKDIIESLVETSSASTGLLFLKSGINSDASAKVTRLLEFSKIPLITDDPDEIPTQSIEWYAQNVYRSYAVIAHLVAEDCSNENAILRNAKYALVAGLGYGFDKPLLMIAHSPFQPPIDFRDLLNKHATAKECVNIVEMWLPKIESGFLLEQASTRKKQDSTKAVVDLRKISLGHFVAENEENILKDYFVETAPFNDALKTTQHMLYVGRKGTGKTANLYQIQETLLTDRRNLVCVIKPIDYELEGVLRLLNTNLAKTDTGYLSESLWKFLVYTELAISIHTEINSRPIYAEKTQSESDLVGYLRQNKDLMLPNFTERMEHIIEDLCGIETSGNMREQRAKVSEILHNKLLSDLRELLGRVLEDKHKVFVLVDNLDKAWKKRDDLKLLSEFLFGLLSASQTITEEFHKSRVVWRSVNLSLIVFLRSDIFSYVLSQAREGDKISYSSMNWNDSQVLQRVVEERFIHSLDGTIAPEDVWERYFTSLVKGIPTKDYIVQKIIPRPRDIIYFCSQALSHAINHAHTVISEQDILQAAQNYSEHAFNSLLAELEAQIGNAEELLYEFAGSDDIISVSQTKKLMTAVGITQDDYDRVIDLLCDYTFLGVETSPNNFTFLYETNRKTVWKKLAQKVVETAGEMRFRINEPFHEYLAIRKT